MVGDVSLQRGDQRKPEMPVPCWVVARALVLLVTARTILGILGLTLAALAIASAGAASAMAQGGQPWIDGVLRVPYASSSPPDPATRSPSSMAAAPAATFCPAGRKSTRSEPLDADRTRTVTTWVDPQTGLQVQWQVTRFADFPAVEWVLWLTGGGSADTPVIEDVQALSLLLADPMPGEHGFLLHRTNGGWNDATNHGMRQVALEPGAVERMAGFNGHSNRRDFPYFRIDTRSAALGGGRGLVGPVESRGVLSDKERLRVTAGQETTHFKLHPGERVRTPRILLLSWPHERIDSNSQFRRLLVKHYVPQWHGKPPLPSLYTNTCFAHGGGGGWLNECDATNQIALIRA